MWNKNDETEDAGGEMIEENIMNKIKVKKTRREEVIASGRKHQFNNAIHQTFHYIF